MILIVDDEYDIVTIMKISLEKAGLSVSSYVDPIAALDEFRSHPYIYDLVISDIKMPVMDGYEFIQQVKLIRPEVRVIIMSAFEFSYLDFPQGLSRSMIEEFVEKPISPYNLSRIVLKYEINKEGIQKQLC